MSVPTYLSLLTKIAFAGGGRDRSFLVEFDLEEAIAFAPF